MKLWSLLDVLASGGKIALITTAAGCLGLIVYSANVSAKVVYLPHAVIAVALVSALLGGLRSGLAAGSLGWFHGALVALVYGVLILIAKAILFPASADVSASAVFMAGLLLAGIAGGITGVNISFSRRTTVRRRYLGQ